MCFLCDFTLCHLIAIQPRQVAVAGDIGRFQSAGLGLQPGGAVPGGSPPAPVEKPKKVVPLSKQLTNKISSSSTKLTELMAWEAKVTDNTVLYLIFDFLLYYFFSFSHMCLLAGDHITLKKNTLKSPRNMCFYQVT